MKKLVSIILISLFPICSLYSQEWLTSLEIAKKLSIIQDKMIFAVWEDAMYRSGSPIIINNNIYPLSDLAAKESYSRLIWKYFVPLIIPEYTYRDLLDQIEGKRSLNYMYKFNDNHIKIMDANGNILNTSFNENEFEDMKLGSILEKYALKTTYLKQELESYALSKNFTTSFRLASKYLDYAIFASKSLRSEISELSDIYMQEAIDLLENSDLENKGAIGQKIKLLKIKKYVIMSNPKKALRMLRKFDDSEIDSTNQSLFAFLHFASHRLLNDIELSMEWQNEVSLVDLKKMKYLLD